MEDQTTIILSHINNSLLELKAAFEDLLERVEEIEDELFYEEDEDEDEEEEKEDDEFLNFPWSDNTKPNKARRA